MAPFIIAIAALAAAGTVETILRWVVRRKVRRDEARAVTATASERTFLHWLDRLLLSAVSPFTSIIWILAGHTAIDAGFRQFGDLSAAASLAPVAAWARDLLLVAAVVWLMSRLGAVLASAIEGSRTRDSNGWDDAMLPVAASAARVVPPILALILGVQTLSIPERFEQMLRTGFSLALIAVVAYLLYRALDTVEALVLRRYRTDVADNLQARAVYTQVIVLKKVAGTLIAIFTFASMLMTFDSVRQLGTSILASAGIAGIIVGFAAQRSIATLLAGLQIAVTQPIRVDDVVIVENEWGRIEEITLTYVVVRIWDQRRLVLPINYFIEQPFQNWTRSSSELLATVFLHVDYGAPLDAIRGELTRVLKESRNWDGRVNVLQVTDARERTLEIRALASAANASLAWDLRCEVREKLVSFLQRHYPESLPRLRAELHGMPAA